MDDALYKTRRPLVDRTEGVGYLVKRPVVGVERGQIHGASPKRIKCRAERADVDGWLAFVGIGDLDTLPVPALHVDGAGTIGVIAGHHQAPAIRCEPGCVVERLLDACGFDYDGKVVPCVTRYASEVVHGCSAKPHRKLSARCAASYRYPRAACWRQRD